ncbi:hypothetical protein [Methylobacterium segetis]|uniref:hypothetical protein n=1 Tax=Methylobacterium segetis TaxID=2488750 RepID=UPI001FE1E9C3|nr:hypothetical protein [Methylobacterium segetis]
MNRYAISLLLALGAAAPTLAQAAPAGRAPALLLHGNYCGPGNNGPLPPIDALDAACARHDACTPDQGLPSRACNARLQHEAEAISRDPREPEDLRTLAGLAALGAGLMPAEQRLAAGPAVTPVTGGIEQDTLAPRRLVPVPDATDDQDEADDE